MVDPIDRAFADWDGLPMTNREIARKAGVDERTIRTIIARAYRKLRKSRRLVIQYEEACR